jgi:hypothetical protein
MYSSHVKYLYTSTGGLGKSKEQKMTSLQVFYPFVVAFWAFLALILFCFGILCGTSIIGVLETLVRYLRKKPQHEYSKTHLWTGAVGAVLVVPVFFLAFASWNSIPSMQEAGVYSSPEQCEAQTGAPCYPLCCPPGSESGVSLETHEANVRRVEEQQETATKQ